MTKDTCSWCILHSIMYMARHFTNRDTMSFHYLYTLEITQPLNSRISSFEELVASRAEEIGGRKVTNVTVITDSCTCTEREREREREREINQQSLRIKKAHPYHCHQSLCQTLHQC